MSVKKIKEIVINGNVKKAVGNILFVKRADAIFNEPNADGIKQGGFANIYTGLINQDASALSAFWACALPGYKEDAIDNAINDAIVENGWDALFRGAIEVLEEDLVLKGQVEIFWNKMQMGLNRTKDPQDRADIEESIQTMKELKDEYMNPKEEVPEEKTVTETEEV